MVSPCQLVVRPIWNPKVVYLAPVCVPLPSVPVRLSATYVSC
jgi:hypothetical protein